MDRTRSLHGPTKLPHLNFKHISMLLAVWRYWHWAGREGWPPQDGGLCPGKGSVNVVGTPDMFLSWDGSSTHGEIFSSLVMTPNAGHAQKWTRGQSRLYPSNLLQFSPDYSGMFPGPSPAVPLLHFFSGCSQEVSLNSLKAEHILSAAALYSWSRPAVIISTSPM